MRLIFAATLHPLQLFIVVQLWDFAEAVGFLHPPLVPPLLHFVVLIVHFFGLFSGGFLSLLMHLFPFGESVVLLHFYRLFIGGRFYCTKLAESRIEYHLVIAYTLGKVHPHLSLPLIDL